MRSSISSGATGLAASLMLASGLANADPRPFSLYGVAGWESQTFLRKAATDYRAVNDGRVQVIEAKCDNSSSGLMWRDHINLETTPVLAWRWKVESLYDGLNERVKAGDDYPVRVYAVRSGGAFWWKTKTIVYVWSNGEQEGIEDWPDPYTDSAHVVPVRSGTNGLGEWQAQSRNMREDFKKYFGLDLKAIDGVAIMTDCDDHHGKAKVWYGDIRLLSP